MASKEKQRVKVYSTYWEGAIEVTIAPPVDQHLEPVKNALAGAVKRANKERGCNISYFDLIPEGVTTIEWGDIVPTKAFIRDREQALRPPKPRAKSKPRTTLRVTRRELLDQILAEETPGPKIPERCPLCDTPDPGALCRECGHDMTTVLA